MTLKKKLLSTLFAAALAAGFAGATQAAVVYDTNTGGQSLWGGNVFDGNFALSSFFVAPDGPRIDVQLGLRARTRLTSSIANPTGGTGEYGLFQPGINPAAPGRAFWNYDFFVKTGLDLSSDSPYSLSLCILGPNLVNIPACNNPLDIGDNNGSLDGSALAPNLLPFGGLGNSEQLLFANVGLPDTEGYDVDAPGHYKISLNLVFTNNAGVATNLDGVTIGATVGPREGGSTVPEPGTLALLGVSLAGLAAVRRKKKMA